MITKEMKLATSSDNDPATIKVFSQHHLECLECQIADLDTLEHGAGIHNISIDTLLEELNSVADTTR